MVLSIPKAFIIAGYRKKFISSEQYYGITIQLIYSRMKFMSLPSIPFLRNSVMIQIYNWIRHLSSVFIHSGCDIESKQNERVWQIYIWIWLFSSVFIHSGCAIENKQNERVCLTEVLNMTRECCWFAVGSVNGGTARHGENYVGQGSRYGMRNHFL